MASPAALSAADTVAEAIVDYRRGEVRPATPEVVTAWANQFPPEEGEVILGELASILPRLYSSRVRVRELLRKFLVEHVVGEQDPVSVLSHLQFLNVQSRGGSQRALLRIADEILRAEYGTGVRECGTAGSQTFVYLDDALYTGNRLRHDLTVSGDENSPGWISKAAPQGCSLLIYVTGCHSAGWRYALEHLREGAERKEIQFRLYPGTILENDRARSSLAQCLWPRAFSGDAAIEEYIARLHDERAAKGFADTQLFRDEGTPPEETLFSSEEAREVVERAFLRVGARIVLASGVSRNLRPLGFEALDTLGFGTLFVSHRNIANNCPLALWWDWPGHWQPLFPRRVNR